MSMYSIERAVKIFLDNGNIGYTHKKADHSFLIGIRFSDRMMGECMMAVTAHNEEDLSCHVVFKDNVPEEARGRVVEYITRANYGMFLGNFRMNMDDGNLVYQIGFIHEDQIAREKEIVRLIYVAGSMANQYSEGFESVINGELTPEEAVRRAEWAEIGFAEEESIPAEDEDPEESEYVAILSALTDSQLESMAEAFSAELAKRIGERGEFGYIPAKYAELTAGLTEKELMDLGLAVMKVRFGRLTSSLSFAGSETSDEGSGEMSDEESDELMTKAELLRRKVSSLLKEGLRARLSDDGREAS